jgi:hypothetical protein
MRCGRFSSSRHRRGLTMQIHRGFVQAELAMPTTTTPAAG